MGIDKATRTGTDKAGTADDKPRRVTGKALTGHGTAEAETGRALTGVATAPTGTTKPPGETAKPRTGTAKPRTETAKPRGETAKPRTGTATSLSEAKPRTGTAKPRTGTATAPTGTVRRIGAEERRARLAVRHRLAGAARAASVEEVAEALVALHATDPASVFLSVGARLSGKAGVEGPVRELERALYEDRTLTRMHGMRHTIFVFPTDLVPAVHASTTRDVATRERATLLKDLRKGSAYDEEWLAETERLLVAELAARGEATGAELGQAVPRLRVQYLYGVGTRQEGNQPLSSRLLRVLGMEGRIARGRPQGTWTSSRFRWTLTPQRPDPGDADAHAEIVRRWLAAFGPATEADLKWWTGWKVSDVRKALAALGAEAVELTEGTGYVLPDDTAPVPDAEPWAALLPALDPTAMGWLHRDWYVDPAHKPLLYDRSGNIGPTVWWNGRVVGMWAQRPDGEIVHRLLSDLGAEGRAAVAAETERLAGWVGDVRVTPRFRAPLEKELAAGGTAPQGAEGPAADAAHG